MMMIYLCMVGLHLKDTFMRIGNVPAQSRGLKPVGLLSLNTLSVGVPKTGVAEGRMLQSPRPLHGRLSPSSAMEYLLQSTPQ